MKNFKKNNLKNLLLHRTYTPYYYKHIILKTLLKGNNSNYTKCLISYKFSNILKFKQISRQLNLCKLSGTYKKTFNFVGLNRHELRRLLNTNKIIHIKKNTW